MSEAEEYIAELVDYGKRDYADLCSVEIEEVALLIYKEASNADRVDMILESRSVNDFFSLLFPFLDKHESSKIDSFKSQAIECLIETSELQIIELLRYAVEEIEENKRLKQDDNEYHEWKECQI